MRMTIACLFTATLCLAGVNQEPAVAVEYTRMGSEAGGNATGEIPPFEGAKGLECPAGYKKGDHILNPYKEEKVLFRLDHKNVEEYQDRLSPAQVMRLKKNQNFYMDVYPTHRNLEFPEQFYSRSQKNIQSCRLDDRNLLHGFNGGVPFPFPKNGLEAIWNVKKPYTGDDVVRNDCRRVVSPSGRIKKSMWTTKVITFDESRLRSPLANPERIVRKLLTFYSYPADQRGQAMLSIDYIDESLEDETWLYLPALRRVRRAPTMTGGMQMDGECTVDETGYDFRGPINDWNWKLLGKKEMYIPANSYEIWQTGTPDEEECLAGDVNPKRLRYELHRVWVVEGTPREGLDHPYGKRVSYYDEDCWRPVAAERYDRRGKLWRMAEYYSLYDYCGKYRLVIGFIYLNLDSGRYEVFGGCRREDTMEEIMDTGLDPEEFSVPALRRLGH